VRLVVLFLRAVLEHPGQGEDVRENENMVSELVGIGLAATKDLLWGISTTLPVQRSRFLDNDVARVPESTPPAASPLAVRPPSTT
jgi:hypothetical protein